MELDLHEYGGPVMAFWIVHTSGPGSGSPDGNRTQLCLSKLTAKGVHWNTEKENLHTNEVTFCYTEPVGGHWVLENNPPKPVQSDEYGRIRQLDLVATRERIAQNAWLCGFGNPSLTSKKGWT
jgi:hypothetical protein